MGHGADGKAQNGEQHCCKRAELLANGYELSEQYRIPALTLDISMRRAITMAMQHGQLFVGRLPIRDTLLAICFPLFLGLGACSSSLEKANKEAAIAQQLLDQGDLPAARKAIARAMQHSDDQLPILLLDARIKYRMQDFRAAFDAYRVVLALDPNNLEALVATAQLALALGDKDTARDMIRRGLAIEPGQPEILLTRGVLELDAKKYDQAITTGEEILKSNPADPRGIVLKARGMFLQGEKAQALQLLRDTITRSGNNSLLSSALLEVARAEGDVPVMLEQFAFLSSQNQDSVDLALDEINVRYKSGDVAGARTVSLDFLRRFGSDAGASARLVDMWGEYDKRPLTDSDIASLASDIGLEGRLAVARYYVDHSDLASAGRLVAGSTDARAAGMRARIGVLQGQASAAAAAKAIIDKDTTNCEALTALAEWDLAQGKSNAAVSPAQLAATNCRDRIDGYLLLAKAYEMARRPAGVERVFREGIEAHPLDPQLTAAFTDWLLSTGRDDAAVSAASRLSKVAPARESTWRVYRSVCERAGDKICAAQAAKGLETAKTNYSLDPLPGTRQANPLIGRTWR